MSSSPSTQRHWRRLPVGEILSNPHHTYVTPPGHGFLPLGDGAPHLAYLLLLLHAALDEARVFPANLPCVCYSKEPGMGALLQLAAAAASRARSLLWSKPFVAINQAVGASRLRW
ncbi:hypothetical protein ABZP36_013148 [Zizania latifolia]